MDRNSLKYLDKISNAGCGICPPHTCQPVNLEALRFGKSETPFGSDFLPVLLESPARQFSQAHARCSAYALSFYTTFDFARSAWAKLNDQNPNFGRKRPVCIQTNLQQDHGVATPPTSSGHFDFHEYKSTSLERCSRVIGRFM